jgi:hypothetical protein
MLDARVLGRFGRRGEIIHGFGVDRPVGRGLAMVRRAVSLLGKVYLGVSLALFVVGVAWASNTLQANSAWVEIVLAVPRLDLLEPLERIRYEVNLAGLVAGWVVAVGLLAVLAMRAPFRIRGAALTQRRIRDLEREVLELRTLPLRQHEEDEILAAEAHVDVGTKKVMTEKLARDVRVPELPPGAEPRGAVDDLEGAP